MPTKKTRVVIGIGGSPRSVLSIDEHKSGDLTLELYGRQLGDGPPSPFAGDPDQFRGKKVKQHRLSIHTSPNSPRSNSIKLHFEFEDGTYRTEMLHTTAIKQKTGITPIFARLCSSMSDESYLSKPRASDTVIDLGTFDPRWFTLQFAVFLGSKQTDFPVPSAASVVRLDFDQFRLFFIWSFLTLGATGHNRLSHVTTTEGYGVSDGYPPDQCVGVFDYFREHLKQQILSVLGEVPSLLEHMPFMGTATYVPRADQLSLEYAEWLLTQNILMGNQVAVTVVIIDLARGFVSSAE